MFSKSCFIRFARPMLSGMLALTVMLAGCGGGDSKQVQPPADNTPNIRMDIPPSLTGAVQNGTNANARPYTANAAAAAAGTGEPCGYSINENEDHFQNGYKMTKFLVSAIATWSCIGDLLIDVSNFVEHNGAIHATDNNLGSANYDPEDPTHYSVTDDSDSQTTVRLYYGFPQNNPPTSEDNPQFYISWNDPGDDILEGKIVIDARNMNKPNRNPEDPTMMRMDFLYTDTEKTVDMFLRFDEGNQWAEGFRIHLVRDMNADPLQKVYVARGLIDMKAQFLPATGITEVPNVQFYTVSNRAGDGAAIAEFVDISLPLKLSGGVIENHLGNYLFTKNDTYFFDKRGNWDWIHKTVASAEFRGGRTTPASGGTWIPFDPSLDQIVTELGLDSDYFTGNKCVSSGDDCTQLISAVFSYHEDFGGQEHNQGSDPMDWRSDALASPIPLESIYPNGVDWTDAFEFSFVPST